MATRTPRKWYVWGFLAGVILATAGGGAYLAAGMIDPWRSAPTTNFSMPPVIDLAEGTLAPPLRLPALDGGRPLDLAEFRGVKPVVLVFGSFSCDLFQAHSRQLEILYQQYKDRVAFVYIAVPEAGHAIAGYEFLLADVEPISLPGFASFPYKRKKVPPGPKDETRHDRLVRALTKAQFSLPAFTDLPDQLATKDYAAFPARLVVVNKEGLIARDYGNVVHSSWDVTELMDVLHNETVIFSPLASAGRANETSLPNPVSPPSSSAKAPNHTGD